MLSQKSINRKLLIIDDDEATRLLITEILEGTKVSIMETGCGMEARNLFKEYSFEIDLVLLDIKLPDYNGWELLKQFRQENPLVPVIALSAILPTELAKKCESTGFDGYFSKPFDIVEFKEFVGMFLKEDGNIRS
jgi:CheY-like chemotaxis protein